VEGCEWLWGVFQGLSRHLFIETRSFEIKKFCRQPLAAAHDLLPHREPAIFVTSK
jgi:hypothetical protein